MQQLTGLRVKGNVRPDAQNIKISDKGAIVAQELANFRLIHEPPLSFKSNLELCDVPGYSKKIRR